MDNNRRQQEKLTQPDGGYGWIIVLATVAINICVLPLVQYFGLIYGQDFKALGITSAQTSFLLHLHSAIYCCLGLLGSPLLKKYDFRKVAVIGTSLMSVGIFVSSFAQSYIYLIFSVSVLVGVGQGIMLPATYLATNTYFKKRLTLAISFSVTGACLSGIVMPHVCTFLINKFKSTKITVLTLAGISTIAIGCCFLLRPIKKTTEGQTQNESLVGLQSNTEETEQRNEFELLNMKNDDRVYKETTITATETKSLSSKICDLFNFELLKETSFVVTIIGMSLSFASELNIILMIPFILTELAGFNLEEIALAYTIQSVADLIGRLAVPLIGHYFNAPPKFMYASSLITATIGRTGIAIFFTTKSIIFASVCFLGLAKGTKAVYQSVVIPKYVSLEKLPAANGLNMVLTGAANLAIGPLIGAIHDINNSYVYALHAGSYISMLCVSLWTVQYMFERKKNNLQGSTN